MIIVDENITRLKKDLNKIRLCYVNEPSTCSDIQDSEKYSDKRYSYEACKKGVNENKFN